MNSSVPAAGAEILNNRIKEVVKHTQKLQNKKTQYSGKTANMSNKKNFKSNNLSKKKEVVKQHSLNNNETGVLASNCISVIGASKTEESSIVSNNMNSCTNEEIIVNPKIENNPIETCTDNLNTSTGNTITNTNNPLTSAERTSSVLNLNTTSNLETSINSNISNTTGDSIVNLETGNTSVNLNNEIEKTSKNDNQLRADTESTILLSENTDNAVATKNLINTSLTIDNTESESITNENNLNNLDNPRSMIQSGAENSPLNSTSENGNLLTVINVTQTISNEKNTESTNTGNQTLEAVSSQNNIIIKAESEESAVVESIETPTPVQESRSMETYNAKLNNFNTPSQELGRKTGVEKMELGATNDKLDMPTSFNTSNDENNVSIDNRQVKIQANNQVEGIKIKLEVVEDQSSSTSEICNNIQNSSSMDVIPVPEIEESVLHRKKSRNVKSAIKKRSTKAQQRKMYNKQMKHQLREAEIFAKSLQDSKKKTIQPYESVLKPLRAPG